MVVTVSRLGGDDPSLSNARTHQRAHVLPDLVPLRRRDLASWAVGVETGPEQQLGPVDVADTGHDRLVHEQRSDGLPAPIDAGPCVGGVGAPAKRVGTQPTDDRLAPVAVNQPAPRRTDQVGVPVLRLEPHPHRRPWAFGRLARSPDLAEQTEVHVNVAASVELVEQVLPVRLDSP